MMSYHVTHNQVWISRRTVCLQLIGTQVKIYFLNIKKKNQMCHGYAGAGSNLPVEQESESVSAG